MKCYITKKIISKLSILLAVPLILTSCTGNIANNSTIKPDENMILKTDASERTVDTGRLLNPWGSLSFSANMVFRCLFTTSANDSTIHMDLAESYKISEDNLVYEIILKDNILWSDGEILDLEDVVCSIEKSVLINQPSTFILTTFSGIKGAKEFIENPDTIGGISGLEIEGNKLTITLEKPNYLLLEVLSQFIILPKSKLLTEDLSVLNNGEIWNDVATSGMYKIGEHNSGEYLELVYNDLYTEKVPYINKIHLYSDYEFGDLDYYETNNLSEIIDYRSVSNISENVAHNLFYRYFIFNIDKGGEIDNVLSDIRVRKAITHAIDRKKIVTDIYYNTGNIINTGVVYEDKNPIDVDYPYDPEKAKQLLAEADYDFSRPIELLYYYSDDVSIKFMEEVAKYLEDVGLTVNLVGDGNLYNEQFDSYDMALKGLSAYSSIDWYNEYLSTSQLHSDVFGGEPMFDDLIEELNYANSIKERNEILQELQELEYELLYKYPLFTMGTYIYTKNNIDIPNNVELGVSKYKYDIKIEEWKISEDIVGKEGFNRNIIVYIFIGFAVLIKVFFSLNKKLKYSETLSEEMYIDTATGIYNSSKCQEIMKTPPLLKDNKKDRAVIIFDLNDLKKTNDNLGHRAGDELIYDFARQVKNATNKFANEIFVGRYGGDEFVAFLDEIEEQDVLDYIEEVRNLMTKFNETENKGYNLSSAIGYGITTKDTKTMMVKELFDIADEDMYKNKIAMKEKKKQEMIDQGIEVEEEVDDRL